MCRLFAYVPLGTEVSRMTECLCAFRDLAEHGRVLDSANPGHKSGWGIVGYRAGAFVYGQRHPTNAAADPDYLVATDALAAHAPDLVLAHLRKATCGAPTPENTHPFTVGAWSMAHNGNAGPIDAPCYAGISGQCAGQTDSERYVRLFLQHLAHRGGSSHPDDVLAAFAAAISEIRTQAAPTSLSAIATDGRYLYALRAYSPSISVEAKGYYTLFIGRARIGAGIAVSSEPLGEAFDWELLENDTMVIIDVATGSLDIRTLPMAMR